MQFKVQLGVQAGMLVEVQAECMLSLAFQCKTTTYTQCVIATRSSGPHLTQKRHKKGVAHSMKLPMVRSYGSIRLSVYLQHRQGCSVNTQCKLCCIMGTLATASSCQLLLGTAQGPSPLPAGSFRLLTLLNTDRTHS